MLSPFVRLIVHEISSVHPLLEYSKTFALDLVWQVAVNCALSFCKCFEIRGIVAE